MKKYVFIVIVALIGCAAFFNIPAPKKAAQTPYQESDGQLLIPQKNVVIGTADISSFGGLNEAALERLEPLHRDLGQISGVTGVSSLLNAYTIISDEDEINVRTVIPPPQERTPAFYEQLPSLLEGRTELLPYIDASKKHLLFYINFAYSVPHTRIESSLAAVRESFGDVSFEYTGKQPITAATEHYLTSDIKVLLPLLALLISAIFLLFKKIIVLTSSWLLITLSVFFSFSVVRFAGIQMSPLAILIPVFAMGLLSDYSIHYFYHLLYAPGIHEGLAVRKKIFSPLLLSAVSTVTGFGSLIFIGGSGHVLLGLTVGLSFAVVFLGVMMWLPYFKTPSIIAHHKERAKAHQKKHSSGKPSDALSYAKTEMETSKEILPRYYKVQMFFFKIVMQRRKVLFFLLLTASAVSLYFLPRIRAEPYPIQQLPHESTVVKAERIINDKFFGTLPFFIEIDTGKENEVFTPQSLSVLNTIHTMLDANPVIGYSQSLLSVLKQLSFYFDGDENAVLNNTDEGSFLAEQYLLYYSSGVDPLEYESLINASNRFCSVKGMIYYNNADSLASFYRTVDDISKQLPAGWKIQVHGTVKDLLKEQQMLQKNWLFSFIFSSVLIFLMVQIFYRKIKLSLLSLVPGIFSMIFSFGLIALLGISIDVFSIIFVVIIMGLVVDYSIHTLGAVHHLPPDATEEQAFSFIISYSGKPIFISFLTSLASFSVLFLSSFKGARTLGLLLVSSLLLSFFLSFYLLPVIILPKRAEKKESI